MWQQPIYNRARADVDLIRLDPLNENNKGAYNYTDLNRVENNCKYIMDLVNDVGILDNKIQLVIKNDWKMSDIPAITDINRIRNNILTLLDDLNIINFEQIKFDNTMDYKKANALEKNLSLLKEQLKIYNKEFMICGTFHCGSNELGPRKDN